MNVLGVILARAGSKGFPGKNVALLDGEPLVVWSLRHALASSRLGRIVVSTDGRDIAEAAHGFIARDGGDVQRRVEVLMRPDELASDTATVDAAARFAVEQAERAHGERYDAIVMLYGNVPLRPDALIDRAIGKLETTGCDSVQSVVPVGKMHPYWMKRLAGEDGDELQPYVENTIYRRQDLPPVYMLDGGIIAVTRASLFTTTEGRPHAFLGADRRAVVTGPGEVVDVDEAKDIALAEALLAGTACRPTRPALCIGDVTVNDEGGAYVIAELGVNHDGDVNRALELTRLAAECGAQAVKVQLFDPDLLLSAEAQLATYQADAELDAMSMLRRLQLSEADMRRVRDRAHELGLAFIATCFSLELVEMLDRLEVDAVKIASPDCINLPLIRAAAAAGKPMIISTGTLRRDEWDLLDAGLAACEHLPLSLMQCVSAYPVPAGASGIAHIRELPSRHGAVPGYSDHTTDAHMGMMAYLCGARVIEKHLTHDRAAAGPDHAASLGPREFRSYVQLIERAAREWLGGADADAIQADVRHVSRQSLCAKHDLSVGHVITRGDLAVKRPGTGIPAARLEAVIGRRVCRAVATNHLLREADLAPEGGPPHA